MENATTMIMTTVAVLGIAILLSIVIAFPTMSIWNYVMPVVFGLSKISFWQALALLILA